MLISAAVSAGMKQAACVPVGVSVPGLAGKKLPSRFTVALWMVTSGGGSQARSGHRL